MKKLVITLIALTLAVASIEAQNVNPIAVIQQVDSKILHNNILAYAYDDTNDNGYLKLVNAATGTPIGNTKIFLKGTYTGSAGVTMGKIAFANENNILVVGTIDVDNTGFWNALRKYESGTNPVKEKIIYEGVAEPYIINGEYYGIVRIGQNVNFMSSGWGSSISYSGSGGEEWFIVKLDNNLDIQWVYTVPIGTEPLDMTATSDGNLFVTTNNGYKKINAADGSLMNYGSCSGSDMYHYDTYRNNILCVNNSSHMTKVKEWDNNESSETDFEYNHYSWAISKVKSFEDKHLAWVGLGMGKYVEFHKSENDSTLNVIHQRCYQTLSIPTNTNNAPTFSIEEPLKMEEDYFIGIARNLSTNSQNFFGTSVPGNAYVVYKLTFGTNQGQYISLNDISGTHNITQVVEHAFLENGNFVSTTANVGYCVMNSAANIPAVGTTIPTSWNLWSMNGGLIFLNINGTHKIKVDIHGRHYMDLAAKDPNGDSSNPLTKDYFNYRVYFVHIADTNAPVAQTQQGSITLNDEGQATLSFNNIDNGSYDDSGSYTVVSFNPTTVSCSDLGNLTVSYTLQDSSGNQTSGTEIVVISENLPTTIGKNITIDLNDMNPYVITADDLDDGSYASCSFTQSIDIDTFSETGTFDVVLTSTNTAGSTNTTVQVEVIDSSLGISDNEIDGLRIFPNPVQDVLHINAKNGSISHVEIYNLQGQKVFDNDFSSGEITINTNIKVGIYVLKVISDDGKIGTYKVIKK